MAGINIDRKFQQPNQWWRRCIDSATALLITVNVAVFLIVGAVAAFGQTDLALRLGMLGPAEVWIKQPWGLMTYMFVQTDILHLLFNMIWLWGFASLMERFDDRRIVLRTYLIGGLGGALCFLLVTSVSSSAGASLLIGSSASVMAVIAGSAARQPRVRVGLIFFGQVELRVLAIIAIVLLGVIPALGNIPTLAAHLGGAVAGWLYVTSVYRRERVKLRPFSTRQQKKTPITQVRAHQRRGLTEEQQRQMDALLAKVKAGGYKSLTTEEKQQLFRISSFIK